MSENLSRRELLARSGAAAGFLGTAALASCMPSRAAAPQAGARPDAPSKPFGYSLNTATIRGQKLGIVQVIEIAARAGYDGIEPWMNEIEDYERAGGALEDLGKLLRDQHLEIVGVIAFPRWADQDPAVRQKAHEETRRQMEKIARIGGKRMAAPPAGNIAGVSLPEAAERYRALLALGREAGVVPAVELWGFARLLSRLSEVAYVAVESGDPDACLVLDAYHLHKGGGGFGGLRCINGAAIASFHINDYPGEPPRERIQDSDRVFPGDGAAPLQQIFRDLQAIGYRGMLSLELFHPEYYKRDALSVAREGLEKTRAAVAAAFGS